MGVISLTGMVFLGQRSVAVSASFSIESGLDGGEYRRVYSVAVGVLPRLWLGQRARQVLPGGRAQRARVRGRGADLALESYLKLLFSR